MSVPRAPTVPPDGRSGLAPAVTQTHISVLFFLGDRVYKLRKSVRFDFLDFSDRAVREADCHREVTLNRRLAPDVYLGVADVVEDGVAVDHLVVMRRMPEDRRLSTLLRGGDETRACLRALARTLATFHAAAEHSPVIDAAASPDAIAANWDGNFAETVPFVGRYLDAEAEARIQELVRGYLAGRAPLLRHRIASGQICDGHGDLQADDIYCLDDGPRVLDCIEFDDRLRYGDVLSDLAFLAMDLERLDAPQAGEQLLANYQELSGVSFPPSLAHHYCAFRAYVRAKVACLRAEQGDHWAAQAAAGLHRLCLSHLEAARVRLVLVGGLPGTGKSTLAVGLAEATGASVLSSDEVRKELAGLPSDRPDPRQVGYREGLYRPETTEVTYDTMLDRAQVALGLGQPVVLDASWIREADRADARRVAQETASELVELVCTLPEEEAWRRIADRRQAHQGPSDATEEVAEAMAADADAWPAATVIETSGPRRRSLDQALEALAGPGRRG